MPAEDSTVETVVGLHVADAEMYRKYRAAMTPLLEAHGGRFRYDFTIDKVLKSETDQPINRLFIIAFPDDAMRQAFFSNEAYVKIRAEFFTPAVDAITTIARYTRQSD